MTSSTQCFVRGLPRFSDSSLDNTLAAEGPEAAWHCAFQRFGSKAPEQVSGDFSVALRAPNGAVFLAVDRFAIRTLCYRQVGGTLQYAERADELADALVHILKHYASEEPINVGSGREVSIAELAGIIKGIVGFEGEIVFNPQKPDGTMRKILNINRLTYLGWRSKLCLNNGINKAYQDYLGRYWDGHGKRDNARHHGRRITG